MDVVIIIGVMWMAWRGVALKELFIPLSSEASLI